MKLQAPVARMFGIILILPSFWATESISHGRVLAAHLCGLLFVA
jgi:hypothetical protein